MFRKFRRYLINPSESHQTVDRMDLIGLVGGFFGCIIAVIISCGTGFNDTFMHITESNVKNIGKSKSIDSLYWFMMVVAIVQGSMALIQMLFTWARFAPISLEEKEKFYENEKCDLQSVKIEKLEEIMKDKMTKVSVAANRDMHMEK